jgi:hypothetical protein
MARLAWVRRLHGADGLGAVLEAVSPTARQILSAPLVKAGWYPFTVFVEEIEAIDRIFGAGDLSLARTLGRFAAEANLPTIYRLFYKVGSPRWVIERAARLWSLHYDSGRLTTEPSPGGGLLVRIEDFATPHRAHCLSVMGWSERSVELSGARLVVVAEGDCKVKGGIECAFSVSWQ